MLEHITPDYWIANQDECTKALNDNWEKLPFLETVPERFLKDGQLVRFRGMVQDMTNPVLYYSKYVVVNTRTGEKATRSAKYRETVCCSDDENIDFDNEATVNEERRQFFCISVPALNDWAQPIQQGLSTEKLDAASPSTGGIPLKRVADDMEVDSPAEEASRCTTKKFCCEATRRRAAEARPSAPGSAELDPHFPIPGPNNSACLLSLYDVEDGLVKLNEVLEAVGFAWKECGQRTCPECDEEAEDGPGGVVRLHALIWRRAPHPNPLMQDPALNTKVLLAEAGALRADLHLVLSQLLLGDTLAADYLICNLVSSVFMRHDVLSLGKFSLNLSGFPLESGYAEGFYQVLSKLLPKSHYFPLSIRSINTTRMLPVKDYETNRLRSGLLQLSNRTHLVLDETKLEVGKLDETGVRNVQALNDIITHQRLDYDFKYYKMEFDTDIPVLTLSERKSLLQSDVHVSLKAGEEYKGRALRESLSAVDLFLREPLLSKLRLYISIVSNIDFTLTTQLEKIIQDDFVNMRQCPQLKTSAEDLHSLLVLARLMSISFGFNLLTEELWKKSVTMETQRKLRLVNVRHP